ncbi:MAG TPA: hypothetical protein PKO34_04485 [Smithellaceae bacterium]|nr:hypothetical protein [Smithellaceae bacterium]
MNNRKSNTKSTDEIKKQVQARAEKEKQKHDAENNKQGDEKSDSPYFVKKGYLCRKKYSKDGGEIIIPLCNFAARITEENLIDDGNDSQHLFTIDGKLYDKIPLPPLEITAEKFSGLSWISKWGSKACLEPGQTVKDYVRHSIQKASTDTPVKTHYGHTGWREINNQWVYLHATGAIGCGPDMPEVSVKLSRELERYSLPPTLSCKQESAPDFSEAEKKGLETSLQFLDIGNRAVTIPLFCLIYLVPMTTLLKPMPNFSFYLFGQSGSFKTTVALLALAHFGNFSGAESLSNFDDTPGILEKRSFTLKDSLHVIDDYHPSANRKAAESKEGIAQRMIRAYSNRTARGRLNSDMSERGRYEPRGMMLMTAEEQPTLESTLARVCIVEVTEGAIDRPKLTAIQKASDALPYAMTSYVNWLRENMAEIKAAFPARFRALRERAANEGFHKKLPEQAAFMGFALETASSFFLEKSVLSEDDAKALAAEGWGIFQQLARRQQQRIEEDDPVALFFDILATALIQNHARLDGWPGTAGQTIGGGESLVGWYDSDYLYLLPTAIWALVQRQCSMENTHFPFSKSTFFKMLKNREIILPGKSGETSSVTTIGKKSVRVLKIIDGGVYNKLVVSVVD